MEGNSAKVNSIIDQIVENNNSFKLKSLLEQDKEKDSMLKSINSALSVLNEVGKDLVLQDLSVDPDEKFKGFIDSVGNIDISGLTRYTATIVKTKIEEAEKEGLNLRSGQSVFNSNKLNISQGILTLVTINNMIENYDKLTLAEKNIISENLHLLSHENRLKYFRDKEERINNSDLNDEEKKAANTLNEFNEKLEEQLPEILRCATGKEQEIIDNFLEKQPDFKKVIEAYMQNGRKKTPVELLTFVLTSIEGNIDKQENAIEEHQIVEPEQVGFERFNAFRKIIQETTGLVIEYDELPIKWFMEKFIPSQQRKRNAVQAEYHKADKQEIGMDIEDITTHKSAQRNETEDTLDNSIFQEIQQLPIALSKKFSPEQIQEALIQYKSYFENASSDDIEFLSEQTSEDRADILKKEFEDLKLDEQTTEILRVMSSLIFNGNMPKILTSPEIRATFFEQFNQVIEQGITVAQDVKLTGEVEQIFTQYFKENAVDMNVSAIETEQKRATEETTRVETPTEQQPIDKKDNIVNQGEQAEQPSENLGQAINAEEAQQNNALEVQDNSLIGKVKRVMANMRDMKNKDNSKGFFARLGASIQTVFGNKQEKYQLQEDDIEQGEGSKTIQDRTQTTLEQQRTNDVFQRVEVNPLEAVKQTEEAKAKKAKEIADKVIEDDDLTQ